MEGVADPEVDTVQIGRRAGAAFLQALDSGTGVVVDVPPHARVPLLVQRFAPLLTVSGIVQLQQISGPDRALSLSVVADGDRQALASSPGHLAMTVGETDGADARLVSAPAAPLATGAVREVSPYVFGAPRVSLAGAYAVGGQWAYLRLGHAESLEKRRPDADALGELRRHLLRHPAPHQPHGEGADGRAVLRPRSRPGGGRVPGVRASRCSSSTPCRRRRRGN